MATLQLRALWKLHLVDAAILDIRNKAASLDPGRRIQTEIDRLQADYEEKHAEERKLTAELGDLELLNKSIEEKIKKTNNEIYGGKVVNPREVEDLQKTIESLKKKRQANDDRILELWELVPPAKALAEEALKPVEAKKQELGEFQKSVLQIRAKLEQDFKARNAERPALLEGINVTLLTRYESIRQKHGGIGMTTIDKRGNCTMCGTLIPQKHVVSALEDKAVTCESCHRILYATEGLI
jgi:predicted  nucleic acid-binding Zn-ribbon protein